MKLNKTKKTKNRLLIIDGEIVCYQAVTNQAFMTEIHTKQQEYYHMLNMKDLVTDVAKRMEELVALLKAKEVIVVFGGKGNFRKEVLPTYKSNRKPYKPLGYGKAKEWMESNYPTVAHPGLEADDVMGILHTTPSLVSNMETVMVSIDKDMRQIPGLLYDQGKGLAKPELVTPQEAFAWTMAQAISGDAIDGYHGIPGYGPVKARGVVEKAVKECGYDAEAVFLKHIVPLYVANGFTEREALQQAQVSRICRAEDMEVDKAGHWTHLLWGKDLLTHNTKQGFKKLLKKKIRMRK